MARDSGVTGLSGKLVTQADFKSSTSSPDQMGKVTQSTQGAKISNRDSMCLISGSTCPPGKEPHGASRS